MLSLCAVSFTLLLFFELLLVLLLLQCLNFAAALAAMTIGSASLGRLNGLEQTIKVRVG